MKGLIPSSLCLLAQALMFRHFIAGLLLAAFAASSVGADGCDQGAFGQEEPRSHLDEVDVYENGTKPFMAVGAVVCIKGHTYLLQHNSSRPISDKLPAETLPQILDYCRVNAIEPE